MERYREAEKSKKAAKAKAAAEAAAEEDDGDEELASCRKIMWGNLSDSARESFFGNQLPGKPFQEETAAIPTGGRDENGKVLPPPDNFLLILLIPKTVD